MVKESQPISHQLGRKRAMTFGTLMFFIMLIVATVSGYLSWSLQRAEEDRLATTIGTILGESINRISFSGKYQSRLLLEEMQKKLPELAYISVEKSDGKVEAHSDMTRNDSYISPDEIQLIGKALKEGATILTEKKIAGDTVKEVILPYRTGLSPTPTGVVRIGLQVSDVRTKQRSNLYIQIFMIIVLAVSAVWIVERLSHYFSKRLSDSENALRLSTERFTRMAATIPGVLYDLILLPDGSSRFLYLSPGFSEIFGLSLEEPKNDMASFWACFHAEDRERLKQDIKDASITASEFISEARIITPTGQEKTLHFAAQRHPDLLDGTPVWSGVILDITLRKAAELALKRETNRNERASAAAKVALWECDIDTGRLHWSKYIEQMVDTRQHRCPIMLDELVNLFLPEDQSQAREHLSASQKNNTPLDLQCRLGKPDGSTVWWHLVGRTETALDGRKSIMAGACVDITEQKFAEAEQQRLTQQMLHVQKLESLGVLAGGIAHDFNNILCAILGNTELAMMKTKPASAEQGYLKEIEKATRRAAGLAGQMLAYSGKGLFTVQVFDLNRLLHDMTSLLEISISKKASLHFRTSDNLPAIEADETQIRQIIMNLVINASEAIGDNPGEITIETDTRVCTEQFFRSFWLDTPPPTGEYVVLSIGDSGCGMDKQTIARIFDPFFTTKFTGRGLGMSVVHGIIKGHRGAIQVESTVGRGSIFKVFLPASMELTSTTEEPQPTPDKKWRGRILLVEDEPAVRAVGKELFKILGFQVVTADDGLQAVEIFEKDNSFTCVILDLTMPRQNGEQTFLELLRIKHDVKVIIATGYHEQEVTERFRANPPSGFIQKPYSLAAIEAVVGKALGNYDL